MFKTVEDIYVPDKAKEAIAVFGADDNAHPAVQYLHKTAKDTYIGGRLDAISLPLHYDYVESRSKT